MTFWSWCQAGRSGPSPLWPLSAVPIKWNTPRDRSHCLSWWVGRSPHEGAGGMGMELDPLPASSAGEDKEGCGHCLARPSNCRASGGPKVGVPLRPMD